MLNGVLKPSDVGAEAELVVVTLAPGIWAVVVLPRVACPVPAGLAARVTEPVPLAKTEEGWTVQE
jgi:hypothetical protein